MIVNSEDVQKPASDSCGATGVAVIPARRPEIILDKKSGWGSHIAL